MSKCQIIEIVEYEDEIVILGNIPMGMFQLLLKHYAGQGFGELCLESAKKHKATFVFKKAK